MAFFDCNFVKVKIKELFSTNNVNSSTVDRILEYNSYFYKYKNLQIPSGVLENKLKIVKLSQKINAICGKLSSKKVKNNKFEERDKFLKTFSAREQKRMPFCQSMQRLQCKFLCGERFISVEKSIHESPECSTFEFNSCLV